MLTATRILPRLLLAGLGACAALLGRAADDDTRFSSTLTVVQRDLAGFTQLSADNVAIIDGLVRQDVAASKFKDNDVDHTRFSERHTPREREIAGLAQLTPDQKAQLDEYVYERISGNVPSVGSPITAASHSGVKNATAANKLDIHGQVSFTYGWGKGGHGYGTDIVLSYEDPAGRYAVAVGYSDYHGKGFIPSCLPGYGPYRPYPALLSPIH